MVLQQLQALLARLYDVPSDYAVDDFLISDYARLNSLGAGSHSDSSDRRATDEQVLVSEAADGLRVSVYVADEVLNRLAQDNPMDLLSDANLGDYCTALEGVSHFHYLTWRALHEESVSLLELELQAEVDKYAAAIWLFTAQRNGQFPRTLHERLFHCVSYRAGLDTESSVRYREANRCAARFCRQLDERFLRRRRAQPEAWLQELRKFYRLGHAQKLRRVAA
jgi:hypothetical protein